MEIWKESLAPLIDAVSANEQMICFFVNDGSSVSVSLTLYPDLTQAEHGPLRNCIVTDDATSAYWLDLDKTIRLSEVL